MILTTRGRNIVIIPALVFYGIFVAPALIAIGVKTITLSAEYVAASVSDYCRKLNPHGLYI